jgi:hypothetical protein
MTHAAMMIAMTLAQPAQPAQIVPSLRRIRGF